MAELVLVKTPSGALAPADDAATEFIQRIKVGGGVRAEVKKARNIKFHRKGFALFKLGFDSWEPELPLEYKGEIVAKDFERFRKDITILAGFYKASYGLNGEVMLEAKSLSFVSMENDEFERVYKAILTVIWNRVLLRVGYESPAAVDRVLCRLMEFE